MTLQQPKSTGWDMPAPTLSRTPPTGSSTEKTSSENSVSEPKPTTPSRIGGLVNAASPDTGRTDTKDRQKKQSSSEITSQNIVDLTDTFKKNNVSSAPKEPTGHITWSQMQIKAMDMVLNQQKSVFITGSAGTGKSLLLQTIITKLRENFPEKNSIAVTAATGVAACIIGGKTLHSFAGIGLGREPPEVLYQNMVRYYNVIRRWAQVRVLIIDEISMINPELFEKLDFLARKIRKVNTPFGGIQLVLCGDFMQLPPIDMDYGFCFESPLWNRCIHKTIMLDTIFRQRDQTFQRILNEMRVGLLSKSSIAVLKSLERPLRYDDGIEPTVLLPTRNEVSRVNANRLKSLPGKMKIYTAKFNGKPEDCKRLTTYVTSPEQLELKIGAQVMLTRNMNQNEYPGLVNGTLGIVQSIDEDDPVVTFMHTNGMQQTVTVSRVDWELIGSNNEVSAMMFQYPLLLSYAMSIHKSQGQTLRRVYIDLARVFEFSQAYVAISRASSMDALEIVNFSEEKVKAHPRVVEFYLPKPKTRRVVLDLV